MLANQHLLILNSDNTRKSCLNRGRRLSPMPKNELNKEEFKVRVLKLKHELERERHSEGIKFLAHKYLNKVLETIDEYRY